MQIIRSISDVPADNFALEKYFLSACTSDFLLFYVNRPSVIVGRNQQIEAEVNIAFCRENGIEIVRRISGGGTVYHDYGNINYAFIGHRKTIPVFDENFTHPLLAALQSLGIPVSVGARKELLVNGKKISGTAAHVTGERILFHGTLLYQTDLNKMQQALQGESSLRGKRIASVPSPVVNIFDIVETKEATFDFIESLVDYFLILFRKNILS
jgi:lipoate-protein ligase A